jgi:hypothetical protein
MPDQRQTGKHCQMHMTCMTKHVIKYPHFLKRELAYSIVLAYVPNLLDLRAIHFMYHDRIMHHSIGFQSANLGSAQEDKCFCAWLK